MGNNSGNGDRVPYDVRVIANVILERAICRKVQVTNLTINKILYFVHAHSLTQFGVSLIREAPEAWEYGPVYREIYRQFRDFENRAINTRAMRLNLSSGVSVPVEIVLRDDELERLMPVIDFYLDVPAWELVELSHRDGGPWDRVWNHKSPSNPGMLISDELIRNFFKMTKTA